jgi:hypothetical protein
MNAKGKKAKTKKPQLKVRDLRAKKDALGGLKIDYKEQSRPNKF